MEPSYWEQHEAALSQVKSIFNIQENLYQLLEIDNQDDLKAISSFINSVEEATLVSIMIPESIANIKHQNQGFPRSYQTTAIDLKLLGIDIGDINGFFTVLPFVTESSTLNSFGLLNSADTELVLDTLLKANFFDQNHSPYCIVKIGSTKGISA